MPQIKAQTLVIAIQAVDWQVRSLREEVAGGGAGEDAYQLLEDWSRAAEDLERAYDSEAATVINLPAYHELVGG